LLCYKHFASAQSAEGHDLWSIPECTFRGFSQLHVLSYGSEDSFPHLR